MTALHALRQAALAVLLTLAGCAVQETAPPVPEEEVAPQLSEAQRWQGQLALLSTVDDFTARGKVGYRLPDDAGSASLRWEQREDQSEVRLAGPLGSGATVIRNDGPLLRVTRDGIDRLYPADAAPWLGSGRLLPIPISTLPYWLLGRPDPGVSIDRLVTDGGLAREIFQAGWQVSYDAYDSEGPLTLPARLTLLAPDGTVELKVILREWRFD